MFKKLLFLFFILSNPTSIFSQSDSSKHIVTPHASPTLRFTENKGQWDNNILFRAQLDGGALFLEKDKLTFNFYDKVKFRSLHQGGIAKGKYKDLDIKEQAYRINFVGCNLNPQVEKLQQGSDYENFYIGNDKNKWKGNVKNYHQIWLRNLYNGIDYEVLTSNNGLKYNFHLKPNANANDIKLKYEGVDKIKLKNGTLIIKLDINEIVEQKPYAYQLINGRVKQVTCHYKFENNVLSFDFPNDYNKSYELVIDPILVFAAQSGSTADNFGMTATYDQQGNLYSGGTAFNNGYPTTVGSYTTSFTGTMANGITDVVITKYNSTGTNLVYSTYLGGTQAEVVTSLITDVAGNLYLYGATSSTNFPTTAAAYDQSFNGGTFISFVFNGTKFNNGSDIFVSKFNSAGSSLLASTFIGGSGNDGINYNNYAPPTHTVLPCGSGVATLFNEYPADSLQYNYGDQYRGEIQLDKNNDVYVASSTKSTNFPTKASSSTLTPISSTLSGKQDAIIFKLSNNLNTLIWSTYLGGNGNDAGYSLIVDDTLQVYVTGGTYSTNFPTKTGCYQTVSGGGKADGYLTKINPFGSQVLKSTYIGTSSYDQSYFVQSDRIGKIYIFGQSLGSMPVSAGIYSNPGSHQFIMRFNNQLTILDKSTVFGSGLPKIDISPSAFSVDKCSGSISLTGWGGDFINCNALSNMPITPGAFQSIPPNAHDFYFFVLKPNFTSLSYGSYFGGNLSEEHVDGGTSRISESGVLYQSICAGCGGYDDFPVTAGTWPLTPGNPNHNTDNNNCNNGVVKFNYQPQVTAAIVSNTVVGCGSVTVTYTNLSSPGLQYLWNLGGGPNDTTSQILNPVHTYTTVGSYTVTLLVIENQYCNTRDSTQIIINVYPQPIAAFTSTLLQCSNSFSTTNNSTGAGNNYSWSFGDASPTNTLTSPTHTYAGSGNYTITLLASNLFGCKDSIKQPISVFIFNPGVVNIATICQGFTTALTASGGTSYTWSPASNLSNTTVASPISNATSTTIYTVQINNNSQGYTCSKTLTTQVTVFPKPIADFTYTTNPCGGGVNYFDLSVSNIATWQWTLSSTITSTIQNPYNFYFTGGTHTVSLIATDNNGCKDTVDKIVNVLIPPAVSINPNKLICKGDKAVLLANGGISYQWTPTVSLDISNIPGPTVTPTANTQYSVVITTSNSCSFLLTTNVTLTQISSMPISANAVPQSIVQGEASTLTYVGDPGSIVNWSPSNSVNPKTGYSVSATPDRPTTYTVTITNGPCKEILIVFVDVNLNGCIDSDVFIPNTFTPNSDGTNDILYVRGLKVQEAYFAVYNRWGELVWETNDKTKGWDGIYKGKPADVGVFGWYLKVKCFNGEETFKKGNVTLIR